MVTNVFRTPDERFEGLPGYSFEPHYLELTGENDGLRMHYVDEGSGDPILLLHGEPTWAFLYRKMIPALSAKSRVVAPDYIGFGRSDKPTDVEWYSYSKHIDSIYQLMDRLELNDITLVVQDWGGPIGLRIATSNPERFARLVIMNTGLFRTGANWPSPAFLAWLDFASSNPDLPVGGIIKGATSTDLGADVIKGYEAPFATIESKAGAVAFPKLVPLKEEDPGAKEIMEARVKLESWDKPVLVAFSDSDPIFPLRAGERLVERVPGARPLVPIEGAAHFLQEDRGEFIAEKMIEFLEES